MHLHPLCLVRFQEPFFIVINWSRYEGRKSRRSQDQARWRKMNIDNRHRPGSTCVCLHSAMSREPAVDDALRKQRSEPTPKRSTTRKHNTHGPLLCKLIPVTGAWTLAVSLTESVSFRRSLAPNSKVELACICQRRADDTALAEQLQVPLYVDAKAGMCARTFLYIYVRAVSLVVVSFL